MTDCDSSRVVKRRNNHGSATVAVLSFGSGGSCDGYNVIIPTACSMLFKGRTGTVRISQCQKTEMRFCFRRSPRVNLQTNENIIPFPTTGLYMPGPLNFYIGECTYRTLSIGNVSKFKVIGSCTYSTAFGINFIHRTDHVIKTRPSSRTDFSSLPQYYVVRSRPVSEGRALSSAGGGCLNILNAPLSTCWVHRDLIE